MIWHSMDHVNAAEVLLERGKFLQALAACQAGLARTPGSSVLHVLLGRAYDGLDRPREALAECEAALALEPSGPQASAAHVLEALVFTSLGDGDRALASALRALELMPDDFMAHALMGNVLAWHGELRAALPYVEWNWISELVACQQRFATVPLWNGPDARVRRLLVVHGQGLGDAMNMARYLPLLTHYAERVVVECEPAAAELLRRMPGVDDVLPCGSARAGEYDAYVRVMTLPRLLGITPDGIWSPYMHADDVRVNRWRPRLGVGGELRVGLAWAGNPLHPLYFKRSIKLEQLAPLGTVPGVRWFSLMHDAQADDAVPNWDIEPLGREFEDLADAAAAIAQLDLVISVDTAIAHLAGAIGRPVWTMLPRRPDWRWGGSGETTMWYPTMRLFRETHAQWTTVVTAVEEALRSTVLS